MLDFLFHICEKPNKTHIVRYYLNQHRIYRNYIYKNVFFSLHIIDVMIFILKKKLFATCEIPIHNLVFTAVIEHIRIHYNKSSSYIVKDMMRIKFIVKRVIIVILYI